jgi:subtilase family serine protease
VFVSSGDSGSAVCDAHGVPPPSPAQFGLMVSGFESTPYNVSVGGTDFNDLTNASTFWSPTNSPPPGNPNLPPSVSALSYIPETTWNATCTNAVLGNLLGYSTNAETNCNNPQLVDLVWLLSGSGGKSSCTTSNGQSPSSCSGGYAKPSWQTGTGVPSDGKRDVPDVSLFSSIRGPSGAFYLICAADLLSPGVTSCQTTDPNTEFISTGGTSASSPAFAGIMALVDQKIGSRQGNADYVLYKLASKSGNSCPSAANPASTCVLYDVTNGTNAMPCAKGSPNCTVTNGSDSYGVLSGYNTTTGYDLATGLGTVNANNLVGAWASAETALKSSATTLTLNSGNSVNITHGQSVSVGIGVTGSGGTPTGNVSLIADTAPPSAPSEVTQQGVQGFQLSASGSVSSTTNVLPGGQNYSVTAHYPGDGTFKASDSSPVIVTVNPEASQPNIAFELFNPSSGLQTNPNATTAQYGSLELLRMNVTSLSGDTCAQNAPGQLGCPTGSVTVTNNGAPLDAGTYQLNSLGYAEDQTVQLPGGTDAVKVTYGGDNSFTVSNATSTITITKAPTTTGINGIHKRCFRRSQRFHDIC